MLKVIDYAERLFVVLLALPFLLAFSRAAAIHPSFLLLLASECLSVIFILIRRPGAIVASPYAFLIALLGTSLPLLVRPENGAQLVPGPVATTLMMTGLCINISAKLFLNRSFGIVAANRGVKRGGPYRLVRHPMYLGYILTQVGFLLASFKLTTLALYMVAWIFQILRIREEERFLTLDAGYRSYAAKVNYRLVPGVY